MRNIFVGGKYRWSHLIVYLLPVSVLLWSVINTVLTGPFYLSRIDPEYPYLINGLNCAILKFDRIGHVDHPGTPFQILTGIFLQIIHLIAGKKDIVDDVLTRPEFYLIWCNRLIGLATAGILLWLGKLFLSGKKDILGALVVQSTLFISVILLDITDRYIPDRLHVLIVLLVTGLIIKNYRQQDYTEKKLALHTGILMGIGFVTKFNFIPLLLIPLIIITSWRNRVWYLASLGISTVICFLPILKKFKHYREFIISILNHDSLYGQGHSRILDPSRFFNALLDIQTQNISYALILLCSIVLLIIIGRKSSLRKKYNTESRVLFAVTLASLLSMLIIAKHFKNYYVLPMVTLGGMALYFNLTILRSYIRPIFYSVGVGGLLGILVILPWSEQFPIMKNKIKRHKVNLLTVDYINSHISSSDYLLLEPTWLWGAFPENGLVYGFSYVSKYFEYYRYIEKYYPSVLTWEGMDNPMRYFRMIDADSEAILKSGRTIFLYDTPGRNTAQLAEYIDKTANRFNITLQRDTVYTNPWFAERIIRYSHTDSWHTAWQTQFDFEDQKGSDSVFDTQHLSFPDSLISLEKSYSGSRSIVLDTSNRLSPNIALPDLKPGDYLEFTVKCYDRSNHAAECSHLKLEMKAGENDGADTLPVPAEYLSLSIYKKWRVKRFCLRIPDDFREKSYFAQLRFSGENKLLLDDLHIVVYSK